MKKKFLALLLSVISFGALSASAIGTTDLGEPIITFKTNIYDTYGSTNSFSFVIGCSSMETQYYTVDCGNGPFEVEIEPALYDEDEEEVLGTQISCNVSSEGIVKVYGDASLVEYFNADGCYIESIDMDALTNLDIVSLAHNELKSLDLSKFENLRAAYVTDNTFEETPFILGSNHPGLLILEMNYIGHIDQSFNLADYPELRSLDAWNVKELRFVDPTNCPNLAKLSIDGTPVQSLDLSKNPKLQILNISDSAVSSIDVSNNPILTQLYCSHESGVSNTDVKLKSLDLTNNPELVYLFCSGNDLTTLDVSNNTKLTQLHARYNHLRALDLANNSQLYSVKITYNDMDFATLPSDQSTWNEYEYLQRPMEMEKCYAVGSVIDLSSRVLREGTTTECGLASYNESYVNQSTDETTDDSDAITYLDNTYFSYEDGKVTLLKECADSVYLVFHNSELSSYDLSTAKFKIKSAADYGQPTLAVSAGTGVNQGDRVALSIGLDGASESNPRTVKVDFGNGTQVDYQVTCQEAPEEANVIGTMATSYGTLRIYTPEGETLTGLGIKDIRIYNIDLSAAPCLRNLTLSGTGLSYIDMKMNRCLTSIDLSNNNFSSISLEGVNGNYGKNVLTKVDVSNNNLSDFTLNENMTIVDLNLSHNSFSSYTFKDVLYLEKLDFSYNKLTELDLSDCDVLADVNVANNSLSSITLPSTIQSLDIRNNNFTYATLPETSDVSLTYFAYAPQNTITIPTKAPGIDLSDYNANGKTVYTWKRSDGQAIADGDLTCEGGVTHFVNTNMGKVYCEMTNSEYPDFTGENVLKTSEVEAAEMPQHVIASFTTTEDNEDAILTLTAKSYGATVYVDWTGNINDLSQYQLSTTYTIFNAKTKAGVNVKVYSYDDADELTVFSLREATLADFDGSEMHNLICLNVSDAGLTEITLPESPNLGELILKGNSLSDFDFSKYPNLYTLIFSGNELTTADLSGNSNLQTVGLDNNKLTSIKFGEHKKLYALDLTSNEFEDIDLSGLTALQQLSLYGNKLTSFDPSKLSNLRVLYLDHNKFRFSTLPPVLSQYKVYTYANQEEMAIEIVDNKVDLGEEASVNGVATTSRWFEGNPELTYDEDSDDYVFTGADELIGPDDASDISRQEYDLTDGVVTFYPLTQLYPVVGVLQNEQFPDIYWYTTPITVEAAAGVSDIAVDASEVSVKVVDHNLVVSAPAGLAVNVYNVAGVLVAKATIDNAGQAVVGPLQSGAYVVNVANLGAKVLVK
jgi:Leucine-rich repeat (LRR) protein